jgi:GTP-dependent phosphoenolpyruvate carboxykinase
MPGLLIICLASQPFEKPIPQIDEIALSIKNSSSKELAQYFDSTVEIKLSDSRGDFSKNQAEIVMRDFFKKYPAENFLILQQGESAEKIRFLIGRYQSKSHAFRVLVKGKSNTENELKIYGLEFTKE